MKILKLMSCCLAIAGILWSPLSADCTACWALGGVQIRLKSGENLRGYILFNRAWLRGESQKPFPELLLEPGISNQVRFYSDLHRVEYPVKGRIVSIQSERVIPIDSLSSIIARPDSLDNYQGAGFIPVISAHSVKLLQSRAPVAFCSANSESHAIIYWISYNPQILEADLRALCTKPWVELISGASSLEQNLIIQLRFSYD